MAPHKQKNTGSKSTRVAKASAGSKAVSSWWKTSSINRLAKRVTNFTTKLIGYKDDSSNTVLPSTSIKQYICDNWVPQRRQKQQRYDEVPSLAQMDSDVIGHIFDFLANDKDNIPAFLALSHTCRTFNNILGNDKMWEKLYPKLAVKEFKRKTTTKERVFIYKALSNVRKWQYGTRNRQGTYNILLQYLEGADGVNDIIQLFLRTYIGYPSPTEEYFIFRGDTIHYITELIQEHIIDKLWTVNLMVIKNLRSGDSYPQVTGQDLRTFDHLYHHEYFCSVSNGNHNCNTWDKSHDVDNGLKEMLEATHFNATCPKLLTDMDGRSKMARALAYRAGIVKIDLEALVIISKEVVHHLGVLAFHAAQDSRVEHNNLVGDFGFVLEVNIPNEDWRSRAIDHLQEGGTTRYNGDYFAKHIPPPKTDSNDDGDKYVEEHIIIPRHIKDAAVRLKLKPVLLCNKFGTFWAPRKGNSAKDEVSREKARYASENITFSKDDSEEESEDEFSEDDGNHYNDGTSISYCSSISYDSDESMLEPSEDESDNPDEDEEPGENQL